jgi:hypothetical protein
MTKSTLTLSLEPAAIEKIETIAARSGLTCVQLLESIALLLAAGELDVVLSVTSRFSLRDYEFKMNLESLIERHEGTPEELRQEAKKLKRWSYQSW